jgi:hypothetical protein
MAGLTAGSEPIDTRWNGGASLTWQSAPTTIGETQTAIGAVLSGVYSEPYADGGYAGPDTQGSPPGFALSVPALLSVGPVQLILAPEYRLSPAPVWYGSGSRPVNEWTSIGNLRLGTVADIADFVIGTSLLLRSTILQNGLRVEAPINAAVEGHWLIPDTPFGLSFFVASEIESPESFYVMSGIGFGLLF